MQIVSIQFYRNGALHGKIYDYALSSGRAVIVPGTEFSLSSEEMGTRSRVKVIKKYESELVPSHITKTIVFEYGGAVVRPLLYSTPGYQRLQQIRENIADSSFRRVQRESPGTDARAELNKIKERSEFQAKYMAAIMATCLCPSTPKNEEQLIRIFNSLEQEHSKFRKEEI